MRRKSALLALFTLFAVLNSSSVNAESKWVGDPGPSWQAPDDADRGMHVQWFMDSFPGQSTSSLVDYELQKDILKNPTCASVEDSRCTSSSLQYTALLPTCKSDKDAYCIEEFGILSSSGAKIRGTYARNFPTKPLNYFSGSSALNLPEASTGALYSLPEAEHTGGDLYYVSVLTEGTAFKTRSASLGRFSIRIVPVALQRDTACAGCDEAGWSVETNGGNGHQLGQWHFGVPAFSKNSFCVAGSVAESLCAQRFAFPPDMKFYVKTRLQQAPSGWLHGRIYSPDISLTGNPGNYKFEVAAYPVAVPVVYKMYRYPEMPQALKDQYDYTTGDYKPVAASYTPEQVKSIITVGGCGRSACTADPLTRNKMILPTASDPFGMDQLKLWLPYVNDKATALLGTWSMRTLETSETNGAEACFVNSSKGITGIVTTNATQYLAGPPIFNKNEQSLEYKVGAPHFTPKGEVFYGSYDLLMRSDVARCVYGFSNAPIKGSISVTSADGEQKIATESVKEENGWVALSANGFTYSAPTIRVKLSQDKIEVPKVTSTETKAIPSNQAAKPQITLKKKSITCTNGKLTKKVSAIKPKCPAGFKKK